MTAQEKARELVDKMYGKTPVRDLIAQIEEDKQYAKQCALIAIDEIIQIDVLINEDIYVEKPSYLQYWLDVKEEIEKLKNENNV